MSEWIKPLDELPEIERGLTNCSVTVEVQRKSGEIVKAFFSYREYIWYGFSKCKKIWTFNDVIAWRYLDTETAKQKTPKTIKGKCFNCGAEVTINVSAYNGHKSYKCKKCGCRMME